MKIVINVTNWLVKGKGNEIHNIRTDRKLFLLLVAMDAVSTIFRRLFHLKQTLELKLLYDLIHPCFYLSIKGLETSRSKLSLWDNAIEKI